MKFLPGGKLCIRFGFYLMLGTVTVINMATLFSTDFLRHRRESNLLRHSPRDTGAVSQLSSTKQSSNNDLNVQYISHIWDRHGALGKGRHQKVLLPETKPEKLKLKDYEKISILEGGLGLGKQNLVKQVLVKQSFGVPSHIGKQSSFIENKNQNKNPPQPFRSSAAEKLPNIVEHDLGVDDDGLPPLSGNSITNENHKKKLVNNKDKIAIDNVQKKDNSIIVQNLNQSNKDGRSIINLKDGKEVDLAGKLAKGKPKPIDRELVNKKNLSTDSEAKTKRLAEVKISTSNKTQLELSSHLPKELNLSATSNKTSQAKLVVVVDKRQEGIKSKDTLAGAGHPEQIEPAHAHDGRSSAQKDGSARNRTVSCEQVPPELMGRIEPLVKTKSLSDLEATFNWLSNGGHYTPPSCIPREKAAIIFPFRNRHRHLHILLLNLLPVLKRQNIDFTIFVIEQEKPSLFNRGLLFNIGFTEALKLGDFDCFIFHDVDLIPLFDTNFYHCNESPTHFLGGVDKFNYGLAYKDLFGGVVAFTRNQYKLINGASNMYFGWGAEDDDLRKRIRERNMTILRTDKSVGLYDMIKHSREKSNSANPIRAWLLKCAAQRFTLDGLNTLEYELINTQALPLYTWIRVKVDPYQVVMKSKFFTRGDEHRKMLRAFIPEHQD